MEFPLQLQIENYLAHRQQATVGELRKQFRISYEQCHAELTELAFYGIEVTADGRILLPN